MTAVFAVLTFSSCGEDESVGRSFFYPIEKEPKSLDPQICADASTATAVSNIYEGLVKLSENGEILPGVAESMSVSDDGLTYTFVLRDAKWHIINRFEYVYGEDCHKNVTVPVTAHDFVFAFHRIFSQNTNAPGADTLYMIKNAPEVHKGTLIPERLGVVAKDDKTLVITLSTASADFLTLLTQPICMPCNEEFFEKTGGKYGLGLSYTMCNGPFYLSKWNVGTNLYLKKNVDYVGTSEVIPATLSLYFNSDKSGYARRVSDGTYDAAPIDRQYISLLDESVTVKELSNVTWGFAFNCADEILSDANIRIALCKAMDYSVLETPEKNKARGIIPPSCEIGGKNYRAAAGEADFPLKGEVSARQYLQNGLDNIQKSSATVTIICLKEHEIAMRKVIQQWQKVFGVGISASLKVCEDSEIASALSSRTYQVAFVPFTATTTSASLNLYSFYTESDNNIFGYSSAVYEMLVEKLNTAGTSAKAVEYCKKAESYLINDGVFYPMYEDKSYVAFYKDSVGITVTPSGEAVSFVNARKMS